jgi:hypothetical protein
MSSAESIGQWQQVEITLHAVRGRAHPYVDEEAWAEFTHEGGAVLRRPAFWDGGATWRIRFTAPQPGRWTWRSYSEPADLGLAGQTGTIDVVASTHRGLLRMSTGGRNVVRADGSPFLVVGDTPWALPWRATVEQAEVYAADRQRKGFNAALLMTVQPDMRATGPRCRTEPLGFDVGFEDLPTGHINQLRPEYFQYFDRLVAVLVSHGITPVYQPVFHGYGWKGLDVAGRVVPPQEYARYCRYLVARYGAMPAIYLVSGDGSGRDIGVDAGGQAIEEWDCYAQPTGIHYAPHTDNRAYQDHVWLDFQWCQTGHNGDHIPERVADMWRNLPPKAVANGEPTYERMGGPGRATGWWQGHEAWCNLCAGGTMGVVYGAGSLWQWKLSPDEPGHQDWCHAAGAGWREAIDFEGSKYVGVISRIFDGLPFAEMQPNWDCTYGGRNLLVPGKLMIRYLERGGPFAVIRDDVPRPYRVVDPRTGAVTATGELPPGPGPQSVAVESGEPRVVIFCQTAPAPA